MKALLCLDFENNVVHPDGKVSGKGYAVYNAEHNTLATLRIAQDKFRETGLPVVHMRVGFLLATQSNPKDRL